jgi:hypothetical protein
MNKFVSDFETTTSVMISKREANEGVCQIFLYGDSNTFTRRYQNPLGVAQPTIIHLRFVWTFP